MTEEALRKLADNTRLADAEKALKSIVGEAELQTLRGEGKQPEVQLTAKAMKAVIENEKKLAESSMADASGKSLTAGAYLDLSLSVETTGTWQSVTETAEPVEVTIDVPEEFQKLSQTFYILRIHQGVASLLFDKDSDPKTITVDIRIIAATNANLEEMIEKKQFRADLYYRLSTMKLQLPPLRERKDDIIPLANHFIRSISARIEKENVMRFTPAAEKLMKQLDWPGNVRELQNLVECIVQLCPGDVILPEYILDNVSYYHRSKLINEFVTAESVASAHPDVYADAASVKEETPDKPDTQIPPVSVPVSAPAPTAPAAPTPPEAAPITRKKRQKFTRERLLEALEATGNNRSEAAVYLGISRRTLYRKLEEFGIDE